jgi:hypothetical protein
VPSAFDAKPARPTKWACDVNVASDNGVEVSIFSRMTCWRIALALVRSISEESVRFMFRVATVALRDIYVCGAYLLSRENSDPRPRDAAYWRDAQARSGRFVSILKPHNRRKDAELYEIVPYTVAPASYKPFR